MHIEINILIFLLIYFFIRKNRLLYKWENPFLNWKAVDGMQERDNQHISSQVIRPLVMRALRRSNVRKKITDYLFEISPSGSYTSEIAYHVKTTPTNVIGAIRGMESRYRHEESLLELNVVEQVPNKGDIKLYRLTDFGKEIVESLQQGKNRL